MARSSKKTAATKPSSSPTTGYDGFLDKLSEVIEEARRAAARSVNALMTATYWFVGRRIIEQEQAGKARAEYGERLLERLAADLGARFGRGFSVDNLETMRRFYLTYADATTTAPKAGGEQRRGESGTLSRISALTDIAGRFELSWSHYALLLRANSDEARAFYEHEALRGGWSVRQMRRQIDSQFYERTALSRNKAEMLRKGAIARSEDAVSAEEEIKNPRRARVPGTARRVLGERSRERARVTARDLSPRAR